MASQGLIKGQVNKPYYWTGNGYESYQETSHNCTKHLRFAFIIDIFEYRNN